MINFKEQDGELFRMLDEPVPLAPDSKLPCLVRLIQDNSRMGMFNRDTKPSRLSDFYLAARIVSNNIVVDEFMESDYHRFEIIGYPVEEGSKEWALYQMMQGKMVCHETSPRDWYRMYNDHAIQNRTVGYMDRVSAWLESTVQSGWQIYKEHEPKPLLADAKVGDLCKTDLDEWIQIDDAYPESPSPILYHYDRPFKGNIIHTEPLAPEGTAEWALQMWKLGNDIRNETGVVLMADYESEEIRVKHLVDVFPSGWQLYKEPETQKPTYQVGDWVEVESSYTKGKTFVSVIKEMPNKEHYNVSIDSSFGRCTVRGIMERQIVRKLKPSEIIVRIGCLSGTVRPVSTNGIHIWFHLVRVDDKTIATIRISCLDASTREIVEGLLKAQEEETK